MPPVEIVGYCAATLTTLAFVPQVTKSWRSRSVRDLSFLTLATFSSGVFLWLVYGIVLREIPIIAANAVTLALNVVLVSLKLRHGSLPGPRSAIVVKPSPIHGRGVFATRPIEAGEIVIDGCRDVLSDEALKDLPEDERVFLSVIDGRNVLFKPPARFVNHSCDPNARGGDHHDVAIRRIEAGEEVTVDYVAEHVPGLNLRCN